MIRHLLGSLAMLAARGQDLDAAIRLLEQARSILEAFPGHSQRRVTLLHLMKALKAAGREEQFQEVRSELARDFPEALQVR